MLLFRPGVLLFYICCSVYELICVCKMSLILSSWLTSIFSHFRSVVYLLNKSTLSADVYVGDITTARENFLTILYLTADLVVIFFNLTETYIILFFSNSILFRIVSVLLLLLI